MPRKKLLDHFETGELEWDRSGHCESCLAKTEHLFCRRYANMSVLFSAPVVADRPL